MSLSQVQIIRSLGDALAWFQQELGWGVDPGELRHLTGRIGELYAAMITRGQMALMVNQHGYDVVTAEGRHVSVKTVTSSTHVTFKKSTLHHVEDAMILRVNVADGEVSIEELFRGTVDDLRAACKDASGDLQYFIRKPGGPPVALDGLAVSGEAAIGVWRVLQYENGSIAIEVGGVREPVVKPILREIATEIGVPLVNGAGNVMNTRQLGAAIIAARSTTSNRFAWGPDDVIMKDARGNVMTTREVLEAQLERARTEVEEDSDHRSG